jgi:DMSO/TMAO reductase YedYZ molybdopterin-dependent catalytic subunit
MIVRQEQPRNLETPLSALENVSNERFYVRSHFAVPKVDPKTFTLTVEGHVKNKLELSLGDLKKMGTVSRDIVLECAGNSRVFLIPQVRGTQWSNGAVGMAKWTGVPLGAVLERAGVKAGAVQVVLMGADSGAITSDPPSPGVIHYDRGIPLEKAKRDETVLAWEMNTEPIPLSHCAPLRAIVGGWYGMASVKWLTRIIVTDKPHANFWQTIDYSIWERNDSGLPQLTPVTAIQPKAIITTPSPGTVVKAGDDLAVTGLAWAGENSVAKVEISSDEGKNWSAAKIGKAESLQWVKWTATVTRPATGPGKLLARCTDDKGRTQPMKRDPDRRSYMINHSVAVEVIVK